MDAARQEGRSRMFAALTVPIIYEWPDGRLKCPFTSLPMSDSAARSVSPVCTHTRTTDILRTARFYEAVMMCDVMRLAFEPVCSFLKVAWPIPAARAASMHDPGYPAG